MEGEDPHQYLRAKTDGTPNRLLTTEELLLLWVANRNPAFMRYGELFDETDIAHRIGYAEVVEAIRTRTAKEARKAGGQDLLERLLEPARHAPGLACRPAALDPRPTGPTSSTTSCCAC